MLKNSKQDTQEANSMPSQVKTGLKAIFNSSANVGFGEVPYYTMLIRTCPECKAELGENDWCPQCYVRR